MTARPARATGDDLDARGPGAVQGSGAIQADAMLARAAVLYRLFGLSQVALAVALDLSRYRYLAGTLGLTAAISIESTALAMATLRRRRLIAWMVAGDTAFCMVALVVGAALTAPRYGHTWIYFMYPFTVVSSVGIGLAYRRFSLVLGLTVALAGAYIVAAVGLHHDPVWNVVPNAGTYFANTTVAWAVAIYVRRSGTGLDDIRAQAVERAAAIAAQHERLRHARMLHDHVLQTLETLARGEWISDPGFRAHVCAEAAWLRGLVEGFGPGGDDDLAAGLQRLIRDKALLGLRVEFNGTQLRELGDVRACIGPEAAGALVEAAGEVLTNVVKHSGVAEALMRVNVTTDRLAISVLDHGCGFDTTAAVRGLGLRESIQARLREVGGTAHLESTPGSGTFVELAVPRLVQERAATAEAAAARISASSRSEALDVDEVARPWDPECAMPVRGVIDT